MLLPQAASHPASRARPARRRSPRGRAAVRPPALGRAWPAAQRRPGRLRRGEGQGRPGAAAAGRRGASRHTKRRGRAAVRAARATAPRAWIPPTGQPMHHPRSSCGGSIQTRATAWLRRCPAHHQVWHLAASWGGVGCQGRAGQGRAGLGRVAACRRLQRVACSAAQPHKLFAWLPCLQSSPSASW